MKKSDSFVKFIKSKAIEERKFFLNAVLINNKSITELILILAISVIVLGAYLAVRASAERLGMTQLAIFLFFGILDLALVTRFIAYYIIMPKYHHVEEKIAANWADAIRYSRYPATMIIAVFTIFVFICWIIVSSDLKNYITRLPLICMIAPLICAMIAYSSSALFSFKGTSPVFSLEEKRNASLKSSAYWMVAEYFLIISLIDVFIITVYLFTYIVR